MQYDRKQSLARVPSIINEDHNGENSPSIVKNLQQRLKESILKIFKKVEYDDQDYDNKLILENSEFLEEGVDVDDIDIKIDDSKDISTENEFV